VEDIPRPKRDDEALSWAEAALRQQPNFFVATCIAAAAAALAGRTAEADGTAERDVAETMLADLPGRHRIMVGGDKGFDTKGFVAALHPLRVTPHVAQNTTNRRSAIDRRTARHAGYAVSQRIRKRIEGERDHERSSRKLASRRLDQGDRAATACLPPW
jgi:hypothetical protein